eukprot:scaffold93730_cov48-Phaeocystis_antarctica.AAC.1
MGPDQNMGPGGLANPEAGGCLRAPPQQYDPLLAVRADGGVVQNQVIRFEDAADGRMQKTGHAATEARITPEKEGCAKATKCTQGGR